MNYDLVWYCEEILEEKENKEILDKYLFKTEDGLYSVKYFIGRDYTFGFDVIHVYFRTKFQALCFLLKHKNQCWERKKYERGWQK